MKVKLTPQELEYVKKVNARLRKLPSHSRDGWGSLPGEITTDDEVSGFAGELVVAKALRSKWHAESNASMKCPDVGNRTQVRTISRPTSKKLLVRPNDIRKYGKAAPFVLVKRLSELEFEILGWIPSGEVTSVGSVMITRSGNPVYLVPPEELKPIETLENP